MLCTAGLCVTVRSQPPLPHATINPSPANGTEQDTQAGCTCVCTCATYPEATFRELRWLGSSRRCSELPGHSGVQGTCPAGQLRAL